MNFSTFHVLYLAAYQISYMKQKLLVFMDWKISIITILVSHWWYQSTFQSFLIAGKLLCHLLFYIFQVMFSFPYFLIYCNLKELSAKCIRLPLSCLQFNIVILLAQISVKYENVEGPLIISISKQIRNSDLQFGIPTCNSKF